MTETGVAGAATDGWNGVLGTEFVETTPDRVVLRCAVGPHVLGPTGSVHGGVYSSLIETAASVGAAVWFADRGDVVGVANSTSTLRSVDAGVLVVTATPVHRDDTQQLWRADVSVDGRAVAVGEVRVANLASAEVIGH